jgi:heat shock protein HspQ
MPKKAKTSTKSTPAAAKVASAPEALDLQTVISELQFLLDLSQDRPEDPRIKQLVKDARRDVLDALAAIEKGDDQGSQRNPDEP